MLSSGDSSLLFKPSVVGGVLLSSGDAVLSVNGSSSIEWSDSGVVVSTEPLMLIPETWYHVLASRSVNVVQHNGMLHHYLNEMSVSMNLICM